MNKIESFSGKYRFLSNFWLAPVVLDGSVYPSVEHAYQAAKFPVEEREAFKNQFLKPSRAKAMGRGKQPREWRERNLDLMLDLLRQKFTDPLLKEKLLATGYSELIEGNNWGDTFYGVCKGEGENHLGRMLMKVREESRE